MTAVLLMALASMPLRAGQIIIPATVALVHNQHPSAGCAALQQAARSTWSLRTVAAAAAADGRRRTRSSWAPAQQQQKQQQQASQPLEQQSLLHGAQSGQTDEQQQQNTLFQLLENAPHLGLMRGSQVPQPAASAGSDASSSITAAPGGEPSQASDTKLSAAGRRRGTSRGRSTSSSSNSETSTTLSSNRSSRSSRSSRSRIKSASTDESTGIESPADAAASAATVSGSSASSVDDSDDGYDAVVDDAVPAAIARIGRFLDFRERCAKEVLAKLESLGCSKEVARQALAALQRSGLQSDERFAEMFVRGYWNSKAQSPSRLAYELRARGVASEHIDAALAAVFGSSRQLPVLTREAGNELEEEAWQRLVEVCRQRAELSRAEPAQKRRAKLANWLQRRGHNMSTIFKIFEAVGI